MWNRVLAAVSLLLGLTVMLGEANAQQRVLKCLSFFPHDTQIVRDPERDRKLKLRPGTYVGGWQNGLGCINFVLERIGPNNRAVVIYSSSSYNERLSMVDRFGAVVNQDGSLTAQINFPHHQFHAVVTLRSVGNGDYKLQEETNGGRSYGDIHNLNLRYAAQDWIHPLPQPNMARASADSVLKRGNYIGIFPQEGMPVAVAVEHVTGEGVVSGILHSGNYIPTGPSGKVPFSCALRTVEKRAEKMCQFYSTSSTYTLYVENSAVKWIEGRKTGAPTVQAEMLLW